MFCSNGLKFSVHFNPFSFAGNLSVRLVPTASEYIALIRNPEI